MRIVITGSSGRVGRAIHAALVRDHDVVGIDRTPFATSSIVGDFTEVDLTARALEGADAVVHTAALHAPHVGRADDAMFERVNVEGTASLVELAKHAGVKTLVFTSSTAVYGHAVRPDACTWIDASTTPEPETIYHRTKLAAERLLEREASDAFRVRVVRMSRCFPEPAPTMAVHRLHRGVDVRDVADAHAAALDDEGDSFRRFIASGATPFERADLDALATDAPSVLRRRAPDLVEAFEARGWPLPTTIDRVYASGWRSRHGFDEVLAQLDRRSLEVLPPVTVPAQMRIR